MSKGANLRDVEVLALVAGVAVAGWLIYKTVKLGGGLLSGDNTLTKNATNADGQKVTAYRGVPVLGTLGAAANAASGGWLATMGQKLGSWLAPTPSANDPVPAQSQGNPAATAAWATGGPDLTNPDEQTFSAMAGINGFPM